MIKKSYSQLGQDLWVLDKYPINNGYFVDVGFNDGIEINNTYLLELNGWTGIGVDPMPKNYTNRNNTKIFVEAVYSEADIELDFAIHGALSGFVNKINHHKKILTDTTTEFIKLKTKTLTQILQTADAPEFIHYLSLDTEGSEYEILETLDYKKYSFGCITVEHNYLEINRSKIRRLLESFGYKLDKKLKWDDCYVNVKQY
jgi:hypothetical protein